MANSSDTPKMIDTITIVVVTLIILFSGLFFISHISGVVNNSITSYSIKSVSLETHTISSIPESFYLTQSDMTLEIPKIVSGSEVVTMGGITLVKDVDYTIDYNTGEVTIL